MYNFVLPSQALRGEALALRGRLGSTTSKAPYARWPPRPAPLGLVGSLLRGILHVSGGLSLMKALDRARRRYASEDDHRRLRGHAWALLLGSA